MKFKNMNHRILWGLVMYNILLGSIITALFFLIETILKTTFSSPLVFCLIAFLFFGLIYLFIVTYSIVKEDYFYLKNKLTIKSRI